MAKIKFDELVINNGVSDEELVDALKALNIGWAQDDFTVKEARAVTEYLKNKPAPVVKTVRRKTAFTYDANRQAIVNEIYRMSEVPYKKDAIRHILELMEEAIANKLANGKSVRLMGFMSIKNRQNKGKTIVSNFTGTPTEYILKHNTVSVKVSKGCR
jgi:nucleoid DNA-binding protein